MLLAYRSSLSLIPWVSPRGFRQTRKAFLVLMLCERWRRGKRQQSAFADAQESRDVVRELCSIARGRATNPSDRVGVCERMRSWELEIRKSGRHSPPPTFFRNCAF